MNTKRTVIGIKCPKCGHPVWVEQRRTQSEAESGVTPYACQKCGYERYFEWEKMKEWKKKTIQQAVEDDEDTVTLHFKHKKYFNIENEKYETDKYGNFEFELGSFFVLDTLGLTAKNTVAEAIEKVTDYLLKHEDKNKEEWKHEW